MTLRTAIALALAATVLVAIPAAAEDAKPPAKVTVTGCVEAGVTSGCLVLKDEKKQGTFTLWFKDPSKKPQVGTAVKATGTVSTNSDICMQGQPLEVETLTIERRHCPAPPAAK